MAADHDPRPKRGDSTRCVHAGRRPDPERPGLALPLERSSTFLQHAGTHTLTDRGDWDAAWVYSRYRNPTVEAVEEALAELEGAQECALFASGVAALFAAIRAVTPPRATIALAHQLYGGTLELVRGELEPLGFEVWDFDVRDPDRLADLEGRPVGAVVCESLSNPTLLVADLPRLAARAHSLGAALLVDATFATPVFQRPLELGADLAVHSASKFLGGHSDLVAGVVSGGGERIARVRQLRKTLGAILDPAAAVLIARGVKTLALRVRAQAAGAQALARALEDHSQVGCVHYPGLATHPDHALCQRLLSGAGSVLSFVHRGGDGVLRDYVSRLRLAADAPSLGGVETIVSLPAFMSHAALDERQRAQAGVVPGMVRVAVGIEDPQDLVADFLGAF